MADGKLGVNFCIINSQGEILLQQRDTHCPNYPLAWVIPGGGQAGNESLLETVIREVYEEYHLEVTADDCTELLERPWPRNPGKVYIVKAPTNQIPKCGEGRAMEWVPLSKLHNRELGFHHNDIVEIVRNYFEEHQHEWVIEKDTSFKERGEQFKIS